MKRILLTSVLVPFGLAFGYGCAAEDGPINPGTTGVMGTAGNDGTSGSGNAGSDGTSGSGNAGSVGTAGDTGMGGSVGMGGSGVGGNAGATGGNGGMGVGGMAGTGGMPGNLIDDVAGQKSNMGLTWKDSWFITGCAQQAGHDCVTIQACPNPNAPNFEDRGSVVNETFPLGGAMGTNYAVTFKFNAIAEGKFMQGGMWAVPATDAATGGAQQPTVNEGGTAGDTFYIGGTATTSNYNVMRIRVLDSTMKEVGRYYMNGYPGASGAESHRTFSLSYSHTITVPGKGFVEYHIADSNCHAIDNCGPGPVNDGTCNAARSIPNEPNAALPGMYTDVSKQATTPAANPAPVLVATGTLNPVTGAKQPWHSQLGHFTITGVVAK